MLLALFVIAVFLPNVGRIVIGRSVTPQIAHVEGQFVQSLLVIGVSILPVLCIFFLARRWPAAEVIAWLVLATLVVGVFVK